MEKCDFCGEPAGYTVKTGVSAYRACASCARYWTESDHTREALEELRKYGQAKALKGA